MGTIAFFPWLQLSDDIHFRDWAVVRYTRAAAPFGAGHPRQRECDLLLRDFADSVGAPIVGCSLILKNGDLWPIGDAEMAELFRFSEALAFTALAEREFFYWNYWNRDNLRLTVRHYQDPEAGTTLQVARRDGATISYVATDKFQTRRPMHVPHAENVRVDPRLLSAVDAAYHDLNGARIWDAVTAYNQANTDNPDVPWEIELVYLVSAFQRLLQARTACADLVDRANATLPQQRLERWPCPRSRDAKFVAAASRAANIRSLWLSELCALRVTRPRFLYQSL